VTTHDPLYSPLVSTAAFLQMFVVNGRYISYLNVTGCTDWDLENENSCINTNDAALAQGAVKEAKMHVICVW